MSNTRIVATIGPVTASADQLKALSEAGMNVVRLNGSHADLDWHAQTINLVRETLPGVPILLDIPGRKIRTLMLKEEPKFSKGEVIILTTDEEYDGVEKVPVNYSDLHIDLKPGHTVLADDGTLRFEVKKVCERDIYLCAETAGCLRSRKGINVPFVNLQTKLITDRDRAMVDFAKCCKVDFIGISFVESKDHVEAIRELVAGSWPRIVSKVENQGGLENVEEIVNISDVIMIDRGDLSVETNLEELLLFQKHILEIANSYGKPVIVATEMLHTMIDNPFPTKAEVSDITNAVLDGCAATMLSGETAIGANPKEAVKVMRGIADVASGHLQRTLDNEVGDENSRSVPQAMDAAISVICRQLPVTKIVAVTVSGYAARMVAARRPRQPIIGVSNDIMTARSLNLLPGTEGVFFDIEFSRKSTDHLVECIRQLWYSGKLVDEDLVLVTALGYPNSGNRMNLIQTHLVSDLIQTLEWVK